MSSKLLKKFFKKIVNDKESFLNLVGKEFIIGDNQLKRRTVRRQIGKDWWSTPRGLIILDPRIRDIDTRKMLLFRRRFRIPGPFFKTIWCLNVFLCCLLSSVAILSTALQ